MDFKHVIIAIKDRGDKNDVDENVSDHGTQYSLSTHFKATRATRGAKSKKLRSVELKLAPF